MSHPGSPGSARAPSRHQSPAKYILLKFTIFHNFIICNQGIFNLQKKKKNHEGILYYKQKSLQ